MIPGLLQAPKRLEVMRQSLLEAPGKLELRDVPLPTLRSGELLVQVELALTCGTDLKTYRRGHPKFPLPTPIGHEFTGVVARVGPDVTRFKVGDPIMAVPSAPCGVCDSCLIGMENLCEHISGETMAWGAFADCIRIPAHVVRRNVFKRPSGLDLRHAAMLEPLSCVVAGVERLDLHMVDTALVLGAGPMGLLFTMLLKKRGVPRVVVLGKRRTRLAAARELGADVVLDLDDPQHVEQMREHLPYGACSVIECVGRPEAWSMAIDHVRRGGEVLLYGGCASGTSIPLDTRRMHYEAITLKGAFHFTPSEVRIALDMILSGGLPLDLLVSGEYPLSKLDEALEVAMGGECLKLAIVPDAPAAG